MSIVRVFAGSAALLTRLRSRAPAARNEAGDGALAHLGRGLRSARSTRYVVPLLLVVAMVELTYGAQTVQLVLYAARSFEAGAAGYGYLLAALGVGGLLSALVNGRLAASTRAAPSLASSLSRAASFTGRPITASVTAAIGLRAPPSLLCDGPSDFDCEGDAT